MKTPTEVCTDLADHLADATGYVAEPHVPDVIDATDPVLVMEFAPDWLTDGQTFETLALSIYLYVLIDPTGENGTDVDTLTGAVATTISALPDAWQWAAPLPPSEWEQGENTFLGVRLTVAITL